MTEGWKRLMRDLINCLWFDGRGAEAALYYTSIFPNSAIS
ncbi:MAG: VOC family protein, partial [Paeniglutamicibacter terrestris]